jgi:hypothetical protein
MTSFAISPFTMPAALAAGDNILGHPDLRWSGDPANKEQAAFLEHFPRRAKIGEQISEIRSHATLLVEEHVTWLKNLGWDAQISSGAPGDVYLAAVLDLLAAWALPGRAYKEGDVDRTILQHGAYTSRTFGSEHPCVEVVTRNPSYSVCFQQIGHALTDRDELLDHAVDMASRRASDTVHLDFPMVDLQVRDEARYMLGLRSGANIVTQACEQLRLKLNHLGAHASAAAELGVTRGAGPMCVKIEGPFVVAINRLGVPKGPEKVVFAAYCDKDSWKKPVIEFK